MIAESASTHEFSSASYLEPLGSSFAGLELWHVLRKAQIETLLLRAAYVQLSEHADVLQGFSK